MKHTQHISSAHILDTKDYRRSRTITNQKNQRSNRHNWLTTFLRNNSNVLEETFRFSDEFP